MRDWTTFTNLVPGAVPLVYLAGGWMRPSGGSRTLPATVAATAGAVLAAAGIALAAVGHAPPATGWLRGDAVALAMLGLIAFLAVILVRYATTYLQGDEGRPRFLSWLLTTLACLATLVLSDHLLLLVVAWIGTSLSLHRLLVFYPDRPQALLAAHKKFLVSRLADLSLLTGVILLGSQYDTFHLSGVLAAAQAHGGPLPGAVRSAMVLVALAAMLKCAVLPFHGWLIQVMETPTPVSALLHAGIINLGGFLLISMAPLLHGATEARWLLIAAGAVTATIGGLVTMTRVSVKVGLAWSTCAQMGFMLMECGLGAYSLAFLHLLAHALYKAHSFLASGRTVAQSVKLAAAPPAEPGGVGAWLFAFVAGEALAWFVAWAAGALAGAGAAFWCLVSIVGLSAATLVGEGISRHQRPVLVRAAASALLIAVLYFAWHRLFEGWLPMDAGSGVSVPALLALAAFIVQFGCYVAVRTRPRGQLASRLYPFLFHGLYLDEAFTRLTFRIWPPSATVAASIARRVAAHHA